MKKILFLSRLTYSNFSRAAAMFVCVAFICGLFLFSGIFLDATAESERAEAAPSVAVEAPAAAEVNASSVQADEVTQGDELDNPPTTAHTAGACEMSDAVNTIAGTPLGGFIGITPFRNVFVGTADEFVAAINGATAGAQIYLTSDITLGPTHVPVLTAGDPLGMNSVYLNGNGHTVTRTYPSQPGTSGLRHLYIDGGSIRLYDIIFCGITTGTFSMTENIVRYGGGIRITDGGKMQTGNSVVIRNSTAQFGGAIEVRGANSLAWLSSGALLHDNAATVHGGGIYVRGDGPQARAMAQMASGSHGSHALIINNKVEGRVWFDPIPLTPAAITALNNGAVLRNWYTANGYGGSDLTAPLPGRYDFPRNVSRGGGGVAVMEYGAFETWVNFDSDMGEISGNFAERGGGIYARGNGARVILAGNQRIVDNSAHHSEFRSPSISPLTSGGGQPDGANPSPAGDFTIAHRRASGSGGGIHVSGNGARLNISSGYIARNISIADVSGVTTGGGGGVAVLNGAVFNFDGGMIGGTTQADANMLSNWEPCVPTHNGVHITGGCTPLCHPNHPGIPTVAGPNPARNAGWSNLFPCVNGFREGYNRVGANRVGWTSARGAHAFPIMHDGAGIFVYNAHATIENGVIQHNRVCEAGNQTSGSSGGGIAVHGPNSVVNVVQNTSLTHNSAGLRGGGIYIAGGTVNLSDNALLAYNMVNAAGMGGGVAVSGGTFNMNNNATIRDHRYNNQAGRPGVIEPHFANGGGISVHAASGGRVNMNGNSLVANNFARVNGGGVFMDSNSSGGAYATPAAAPIPPIFTMNDNSQIRSNAAGRAAAPPLTASAGNGGGVAIVGHGNVFTMNNNAAVGARADASTANVAAHRNIATNHGGGIFSTGNGNTINMSMGAGAGTTAIRGNHTTNNGGGVLIGGGLHITRTATGPGGVQGHEVGRNYPTLNIGATALIADNEARRTGTGAAGGGGGGIYVGNFNNDNSMAGVNLLGGTITRNSTGMTANTNGGGVKVRSQARGDNNTIAGLDNHFGFRATSGTISENSAAPTAPAAANGNGGGIFTISYLHRSPLANNPLFEAPFVSQAQADDYILRNYSNLNISADTVFADNTAARRSFPPLGDHLPHVQWNPASGSSITYGQMPAASPAYINPPAANTALYIINNFDINYIRPNNDFWFVKEDGLGNPLPGALFRLNVNTPTGAAAPGSPAGTPTGTAAGERISLENGLVGFPLALSRYGPTQIYALTEVEVRNADNTINEAVVIPDGYWRVTLPTRLAELNFTNSIAGEPEFNEGPGVDGHAHPTTLGRLMWRVHNLLIQPATFSFFKTDMSIYNTPANQSPPRLTGANFSLYRWTPQSPSTTHASAVTPAGTAAGYWTQVTNNIPSVAASNNAHIFNFVATSQDAHTWHSDGGSTIFHLVETQAPSGFELPTGQWRFVLELDTTTGNAITPGHDHIRPVLAPSSTAPAFVQPRIGQSPPDTTWYVGNEQTITPTGLFLEASRTPVVLTVCGVALFFAARGAVHARKRIEELPMIVPIKRK